MKSGTQKVSVGKVVMDIRRKTGRHHSFAENIRIVLYGRSRAVWRVLLRVCSGDG